MEDETLPNNFQNFEIIEESEKEKNQNLKDIEAIYSFSQTKAWTLLKNYIETLKLNISISSKSKTEVESLSSYGAKRLAADAVENELNNVLNFVYSYVQEYKEINK